RGLELGLARQIGRGLLYRARRARASEAPAGSGRSLARDMARRFLAQLPDLREALTDDVQAAYTGDPAATGTDEIVFCYPGVYAIAAYRVAHAMLKVGVPVLPRMLTEHAHARTGIDIHPG